MRKLTHTQFVEKVNVSMGDKVTILSEYNNTREKIKAKCNICSFNWMVIPRTLMRGHGCPMCGNIVARETKKYNVTTEDFKKKLLLVSSQVEVLSDYISAFDKIKIKCLTCNNEWTSTPTRLLKKDLCTHCGHISKGLKHRKSPIEYAEQIKTIYNGTIELLNSYTLGTESIQFKCNQCKTTQSKPAIRLLRRGCPICCLSKGETKIKHLLDLYKISYIPQYTFSDLNKGRLKYDFAIFKNNELSHLIEYDGEQHYRPVGYFGGVNRYKIQLLNDALKTDYCITNNIRLIRIKYDKYKTFTIDDLL